MHNASTIDLYTTAGNLDFFKNFQFQLREIGVNVHMVENDYEQMLMASSSGPDHLAIVLTMEGRGMLVHDLAGALEKSGTLVLKNEQSSRISSLINSEFLFHSTPFY